MQEAAQGIEEALDAIEQSILPSLSHLLDGLLDSAALARPGADADAYATELRYAAHQIAALTELIAAVTPAAVPAQSAQPAEASRRMSA